MGAVGKYNLGSSIGSSHEKKGEMRVRMRILSCCGVFTHVCGVLRRYEGRRKVLLEAQRMSDEE